MTARSLTVRRLTTADWAWITTWFTDPALDRELGPVDEAWLELVTSETEGVQLAIEADGTPTGLVGVTWDPQGKRHAITDFAVNPALRRTGLGSQILTAVTSWEHHPRTVGWVAFVDPNNVPAQRFFTASGWQDHGIDDGMRVFTS